MSRCAAAMLATAFAIARHAAPQNRKSPTGTRSRHAHPEPARALVAAAGRRQAFVEHLLSQGYLSLSAPAVQDTLPTPPAHTQPSALRPEAVTPPEPSDHLRSLAGARMYLFDICERLFARRDPALAQHFHSALRAARDRDSMLDVGESLLEEVSQLAGAERAETIRERMKQLLPREQPQGMALAEA